ncbi:MAG: hypothetical protein ACI4M3_05710 [Acutalibacteraceae bacterium]
MVASILTKANIAQSIDAVNNYVSKANNLFGELQTAVNNLTSTNFIGDASSGYKQFFDAQVTPALTENLTALTDSIKNMMEEIGKQLLDTVDVKLGEVNQNPSAGMATSV